MAAECSLSVTLRGWCVGPTKVLRENVHCRSLSSIHILYNQPLVGGLSVHPDPARQIVNVSLPGGSTTQLHTPHSVSDQ